MLTKEEFKAQILTDENLYAEYKALILSKTESEAIHDNVDNIIQYRCVPTEQNELGYVNSIGGSVGKELKVGSVKVSTLNIARLAYANSRSEKKFLQALRSLTELNLMILDAQRHIIERNVEKGLLPNFTCGLIDFEHLYSTVGINGIYETMKTFGHVYKDELGNTFYKEEAYTLGQQIFETIRECIDEFTADKNYKVNIEQIPGEQASAKFQIADRILFGNRTCVVDVAVQHVSFEINNQKYSVPANVKLKLEDGTKATITEILENEYDIVENELEKFKV